MQYTYTAPTPVDRKALYAQLADLGITGLTGIIITDGNLCVACDNALSDADKAKVDQTIAGYVYEAPPPPPSYDAAVGAVHQDATLTDDVLGAFFGDTQGRGNLLFAALQYAEASGDYTRVNRIYQSLKTSPPNGMTAANVQAIAQHFVDNGFTQITV